MIQRFFSVLVLLGAGQAFAQENLINALANNKGLKTILGTACQDEKAPKRLEGSL